jgi:hypothetical protein
MVINGKTHTEDLIIYPDGMIAERWRRKRGHQLSIDDVRELLDSCPEVLIAGTGMSGGMKPRKDLQRDLSKLAIRFIAVPNQKAIELFNELSVKSRVAACFHLTC